MVESHDDCHLHFPNDSCSEGEGKPHTDWEKTSAKHIPRKGCVFLIYKEVLQPNSKKTSNTSWLTSRQQIRPVMSTRIPAKQLRMRAQTGWSGETCAGVSHLLSSPQGSCWPHCASTILDKGWPTLLIIQDAVRMVLLDEAQHQDARPLPWAGASCRFTRLISQGVISIGRIFWKWMKWRRHMNVFHSF